MVGWSCVSVVVAACVPGGLLIVIVCPRGWLFALLNVCWLRVRVFGWLFGWLAGKWCGCLRVCLFVRLRVCLLVLLHGCVWVRVFVYERVRF